MSEGSNTSLLYPILHSSTKPGSRSSSAWLRGRNAMAIRQELVVAQIFLLFNEGIF
jgi:hypothetical protein